jgi:F1F0 ATPase subunit 2
VIWALAVLLGLVLGLAHFGSLWLIVRAVSRRSGRARTLTVALGSVMRFGVLGLVLLTLARSGAAILLATLLGLFIGRGFVLARLKAIDAR